MPHVQRHVYSEDRQVAVDRPHDGGTMRCHPRKLHKLCTFCFSLSMLSAHNSSIRIETFFRHGEQLGFVLNTARLITALATPFNSATYPHKALLNAIFLWGVRITASQAEATTGSTELRHLRDQEIALFERATKHLQAQLSSDSPRRGLQSIQAEVLLATYLFAKGRGLEGTYHLNAAVSLTTTFGIHRVQSRSGHGSATSTSRRSSAHGSADNVEEGERICTFWRVFQLDRLWAVASNSTAILQEREPSIKIGTPWPLTMAEYEAVCVDYYHHQFPY